MFLCECARILLFFFYFSLQLLFLASDTLTNSLTIIISNTTDNAEQIAANRHTYVLNQSEARSVVVEGWSKAEEVSGKRDNV